MIPNQEVTNKFYRFINFLFVFLAIGLVDIFTLIILIFPFLIIGLLISSIKDKLSNLIVLGAYCFSLLLLFIIYGIAGVYFGDELKLIIHSSLMSVSTYTYFSHLIISYDNLMHYYQYLSYGCMLFCITFQIINKEKWNAALCFLLHFNFLIVLTKFKNDWIDTDLVKLSLAVFIPIVLGIAIAIVVRLVYFISSKAERIKPILAVVMIGMVLSAAMHYQVKEYHKLNQSDSVPKEVISIYEKITNNYFPFSYAVVNDNSTQIISTNKHFFINYDEFSETYLKRDAVYFKHKENKIFLKNNPQCILPKSVLVFIYKPNKNNPNEIEKNSKYNTVIMEKLQNLSKRGRKISVFYNSKSIRVYEIENIPGESKVDHLIF
jgi:hypothetical protein